MMIIGKMRSAIPVFWTIVAILSLAGMVFGQSDGSITGTVKDKTGATVPGATVTIANPEIGVTQKASTSEAGTFVFPLVPAGTYAITVENTGFKKYEKSNVILTTGVKLNTGDLVLEVGGSNETVTVQADMGQLQINSESGEVRFFRSLRH